MSAAFLLRFYACKENQLFKMYCNFQYLLEEKLKKWLAFKNNLRNYPHIMLSHLASWYIHEDHHLNTKWGIRCFSYEKWIHKMSRDNPCFTCTHTHTFLSAVCQLFYNFSIHVLRELSEGYSPEREKCTQTNYH